MRISKKILAIALSILMAVSMMPFTVFAEDVPEGTTYSFTNTSGVTTYKTTAFPSTLTSDGTYKLYQDVTTSGRITGSTFVYSITIDLNGHSITSTANDSNYPGTIYMGRTGKTTSHRSVSVINTSSTPATITNTVGDGVVIDGNYNDFTLGENVTMTVKGIGVWVDDHTNDTVTIDGDLVSTDYWGLYVNGTNAGPNTLTVNGSVTGDDAGIYAAGVADYIVNGTVTGDTGIYQKGGNLTVNEGAVVTGTGAAAAYVENGNGMYSTGDAIVVENNAGYNYGSTTINGGTISSTEAGTSAISTPVASNVATASQEVQDRIDVDVKGGTFEEAGEPAVLPAEYLAEGATQTNGTVTQTYVAKVGNDYYTTIEDAIAAARTGSTKTVTCLDDFELIYPYWNQEGSMHYVDITGVTLDLNGHEMTIGSRWSTLFTGTNGKIMNGTCTGTDCTKWPNYNYGLYIWGTGSGNVHSSGSQKASIALENLTCNYGVHFWNADATITNCDVTGGASYYAVWADECSNVTIESGNFTSNGAAVLGAAKSSDGDGSISVEGGNYTVPSGKPLVLPTSTSSKPENVKFSGGTTNVQIPEENWADGYVGTTEPDEDGKYTVKVDTAVAEVNGVKYDTFEEALAAISNVTTATHSNSADPTYQYKTYVANGTIKLLKDCTANGIIIGSNSNLTIDFNGKTLDINAKPVGSNGTESMAMQLLKDSNITLKNGTLTSSYVCDWDNDTEFLQRMIQNYANLTLDKMTVSMVGNFGDQLTMSNCNGNVTIKDSTVNAPDFSTTYGVDTAYAAENFGARAMSVGTFSTYTGVDVTVTDSTINGYVNIDNTGANGTAALTLNGGAVNGNIVDKSMSGATVTNEGSTVSGIPEGYGWVDNGDGTSTLTRVATDEVSITTADEIDVNLYLDDTGEEATVEYTFNTTPDIQQDTQGTKVVDFDSLPVVDGKRKLTIRVAPAQIRDNIDIFVKDANGDVLRPYEDYSVARYCDELVEGDYSANIKTLAKSVLDYGKAAANFFGYNESAFTNQANNFNDFTFDTTGWTAVVEGITIEEVRYVATSVPSLRFKVVMSEADAERYTVETDKGYKAEFVKVGEDVILQVTGIPASKLGETITVSVKDAQEDVIATIQYTPIIYAYNAAKSNNAELVRLGKTIGQYSAAAKAVFA